ncbi:hypothetical protein GBAR_LOCUS16743 [Geodia barretti]|uniref:B box-type domain-containing protein n=1 Tax=Geodia barretti TaxID=519541 RepID=A0AA35SIC2_GEOBA|nr:hypothetical protein GBAR_LOCUS16743 [Geodia barretti]
MLSKRESSCETHPSQLLTHYCKMCKQLICIDCLRESSNDCTHRQRKVSITEASHQAKDAILASLKPIRGQLASIEGVVQQIQAKKQHISEQATEVNSRIDGDIEGLKAALEQRRGELKEAVKAEEERKYSGLRGQEEDAEIAKNQLSNYLGGVNQCLQRGSNVQVVKLQQVVEEKVREILQEFSSMPQAPVEAANLRYFSSGELSASIPPSDWCVRAVLQQQISTCLLTVPGGPPLAMKQMSQSFTLEQTLLVVCWTNSKLSFPQRTVATQKWLKPNEACQSLVTKSWSITFLSPKGGRSFMSRCLDTRFQAVHWI